MYELIWYFEPEKKNFSCFVGSKLEWCLNERGQTYLVISQKYDFPNCLLDDRKMVKTWKNNKNKKIDFVQHPID